MAHDLGRLQDLVRSNEVAFVNWTRTQRTLEKLGWDQDPDGGAARVHEVILALVHQSPCFQHEAPGCECTENVPVGQRFFDANQYEIHWDSDEKVRRPYPVKGTISFSIKLTEVVDARGPYCGIVTFHLSPDL